MNDVADGFGRAFRHRHAVLPVVHVESPDQALANAAIAREAQADGVFLINHALADETLLAIHAQVAAALDGWWVGVNCLGLSTEEVFGSIAATVRGVWTDNAGIDERRLEPPRAERLLALRRSRAPDCLYFGGVAFKYQRPVVDLEAACAAAARTVDVVTTSGPGTGHAAPVEKVRRVKQALGDAPLAIASGITPGNVADYLPHADAFLVATGIGRTFTELDPGLVRDLVGEVRAYDAA